MFISFQWIQVIGCSAQHTHFSFFHCRSIFSQVHSLTTGKWPCKDILLIVYRRGFFSPRFLFNTNYSSDPVEEMITDLSVMTSHLLLFNFVVLLKGFLFFSFMFFPMSFFFISMEIALRFSLQELQACALHSETKFSISGSFDRCSILFGC